MTSPEAPAAGASPALSLTLAPRGDRDSPDRIEVSYVLGEPQLLAGQVLCRLPLVIVGVPGVPLDAAALSVTDAAGVVPLEQEDETPTPSWTYRRWKATRATTGDVRVHYQAPVRAVDASTPNGPLYDLRAEAGGVSGAGITFLALPESKTTYVITVTWDLSALPPSARGVCSLGEGTVHAEGTTEDLTYMFYLAGPVTSHPADGEGPFSMYWLSRPMFDPVNVAAHTAELYRVMCGFFAEPRPGHRVFVRKHPYRGNGGTALRRSFVFGYSDPVVPTVASLTSLLAHETAHNWPKLDGEHGDVAWYGEGTAEYFSILLPYRAGLVTRDRYLELINDRAREYYTNPLQDLSNTEAAERFWQDPRAQRVPYGRGLFYLIDLNAKLLARSAGRQCVDDLVREVLGRQRAGEKVGVAEWADMVTAALGLQAKADLDAMTTGQRVIPASDALGPEFAREDTEDVCLDFGFDMASLKSRIVTGLVHGGPADRAGVREGDRITEIPSFAEIEENPSAEVSIALQRDGRPVTVRYAPRGPLMRSYSWTLTGS